MSFLENVRRLEETLFADKLDPKDPMRMLSDGYSWLYRPSHHFASGLLTEEDVELLTKPGSSLLSIGAHPAYFERVLLALGVPAENIVIADNDRQILECEGNMLALHFSMHDAWPVQGMFDRIIFPESLCISITDSAKPHESDEQVAQLLAAVITQALDHLKPGGIIRANGPMYHPNIVKRMQEMVPCEVNYERFLMEVRISNK